MTYSACLQLNLPDSCLRDCYGQCCHGLQAACSGGCLSEGLPEEEVRTADEVGQGLVRNGAGRDGAAECGGLGRLVLRHLHLPRI